MVAPDLLPEAGTQPEDGECASCGLTVQACWMAANHRQWSAWSLPDTCAACDELRMAERQENRAKMLLMGSGIPDRCLWAAFGEHEKQASSESFGELRARVAGTGKLGITAWNAKAASVARSWGSAPNGPEWLGFVGPVGTGKTTLLAAAAIAKVRAMARAVEAGAEPSHYQVLWVSEGDLFTRLRAEIGTQGPRPFLLRLHTVPVLFIDDLGATTSSTNWHKDIVENLVCKRYSSRLPFGFTSNLNLYSDDPRARTIQRVFGDRVASRITECVGGDGLQVVSGYDWRNGRRHP